MSIIWKFSPSSETLLQRCIDTATPHHTDNKWAREFRNFRNILFPNENSSKSGTILIESDDKDDQIVSNHEEIAETAADIDNIFDELESNEELEHRFFYLTRECMQRKGLFKQLAQRLPTALTEKFCELSINNTENMLSVNSFYQQFLPAYLKVDFNRSKLNLLVKAKQAHPQLFKTLLQFLVKDLEIPIKVLQGVLSILNTNEKLEFLIITLEQISNEELAYHMCTLHSTYRDCNKTEKLQNLLLTTLIKYAQNFCIDKEYGRFLLTFLQAQNNLKLAVDYIKVVGLVEMHGSAFKKPCLTILDKMA